ncbi:hypothetical protein, partial [Escherichia coli]|uniref:hypothetical protein n=1 Tax=Escherichia coli TaxID=562 RepID=UPI001BAFBD57
FFFFFFFEFFVLFLWDVHLGVLLVGFVVVFVWGSYMGGVFFWVGRILSGVLRYVIKDLGLFLLV